jgi:hypothetical protein
MHHRLERHIYVVGAHLHAGSTPQRDIGRGGVGRSGVVESRTLLTPLVKNSKCIVDSKGLLVKFGLSDCLYRLSPRVAADAASLENTSNITCVSP